MTASSRSISCVLFTGSSFLLVPVFGGLGGGAPGPHSCGALFAGADLCGFERQPLEVGALGVFGAAGTLGRRQRTLGVDLAFPAVVEGFESGPGVGAALGVLDVGG